MIFGCTAIVLASIKVVKELSKNVDDEKKEKIITKLLDPFNHINQKLNNNY